MSGLLRLGCAMQIDVGFGIAWKGQGMSLYHAGRVNSNEPNNEGTMGTMDAEGRMCCDQAFWKMRVGSDRGMRALRFALRMVGGGVEVLQWVRVAWARLTVGKARVSMSQQPRS